MANDYTQVNFRIPAKLKEQIENSAEKNNRSITAELVSRLEQSFEEAYIDTVSDAVINELLEGTVSRLLDAMKNQGVPNDKILDALKSLTNKKAP